MAKKVDMSHLEAHHHALDGHLAKVIAVGSKLKNADDMKEFDKEPTTTLLKDLEKLVNDHEAAEEAVFSTENLQKHFTVEEMKKFRV
jgi:hypothetical protein